MNRAAAASHSPRESARFTANQASGSEEDQADDPAEQPMDPFPEEDELESGKVIPAGPATSRYCGVCLVKVEGMLPFGLGQRRNGAADRLPLGDAEPAFGQPGNAADDDHREHHEATRNSRRASGAAAAGLGGRNLSHCGAYARRGGASGKARPSANVIL